MFVHPELADVFASLPPRPENPYADIEATRASFRTLMARHLSRTDVHVEHRTIDRGIDVQVLRPLAGHGTLPGVLYVHGGGFSYGELDGRRCTGERPDPLYGRHSRPIERDEGAVRTITPA